MIVEVVGDRIKLVLENHEAEEVVVGIPEPRRAYLLPGDPVLRPQDVPALLVAARETAPGLARSC